jgi:hypothetical protein
VFCITLVSGNVVLRLSSSWFLTVTVSSSSQSNVEPKAARITPSSNTIVSSDHPQIRNPSLLAGGNAARTLLRWYVNSSEIANGFDEIARVQEAGTLT